MTETLFATDVHLALHHVERPVSLAGVEHVGSEAGHHDAAIGELFPVDGKGEEIVALKIHHREEGVHETFAKPALCILADGGVGIPATRTVAGEVVVLADGRAGEHHPGLLGLHGLMDLADDARDELSSLRTADLEFPGLRIADIIEVDAIDIVTARDLAAELCQIVARLALLGIHIALVAHLDNQLGIFLA